ncbi:MAG: hypothetical protein WBI17_02845 [Clostridiaceae bacterium]
MKKGFKIVVIVALTLLTILLLFNIQNNREYKSYLLQENENSISSILSSIRNNNEVLNEYKKSGQITYAELSRIGSNYLNAGDKLKDLLKQAKYFMSDANYSHENFNAIIIYLDGISLFISMDLLQGIGNYYPHMYNDKVYELNEDEKLILSYMFDLNQKITDIGIEKGFMSNKLNSKEYNIDKGKNNGLEALVDFIDAVANESKKYFGELKNLENSKLVEKFILDVSEWNK